MKWISAVLPVLLAVAGTPASAQWSKRLDPAVPRTRAGKVDPAGVWLPQPDPKGKPDNVENTVTPRYFVNIMADFNPADVPMTPWGAALFKERLQSQGKLDPIARCQPTGVPAVGTIPLPY